MSNKESEIAPKGDARLREALRKVATWELPETGKTWEGSGNPISYEAAFGSLGVRYYFRKLATDALAAAEQATPPADVQQGGAIIPVPTDRSRLASGYIEAVNALPDEPSIAVLRFIESVNRFALTQPSPSVSDGEASVEQRAQGLPPLPPSFARVHNDGYWTIREPGTERFGVHDSRETPAQEVYSAEQMQAFGVIFAALSQQENTKQAERADMFWDESDPEMASDSIDEIVSDGGYGVGDIVTIQCGMRLPNIEVLVIADPDNDGCVTYEIIETALTAALRLPDEQAGE